MNFKKIRAAARLGAAIFIALAGIPMRASACGPDFPNSLLNGGTNALLTVPAVNFRGELERMHLVSTPYVAVMVDNHNEYNFLDQTIDAEQADLLQALAQSGVKAADADGIAAQHLAERKKLEGFLEDRDTWSNSGEGSYDPQTGEYRHSSPATPPPAIPVVKVVPGLPAEFGDYMDGVIAWDNPTLANKDICRQVWERLLARPAGERHFKSVAAAFMLGRSWDLEDPDKAATYYQQVRALAKQGLADRTGLAAASLGQEARLYLRQKRFADALDLYLEQVATGDTGAAISIQFTAAKLFAANDQTVLSQFAADPKIQRVITACLLSHQAGYEWNWSEDDSAANTSGVKNTYVERWLMAVESAGVTDVDSAEKFALAAYQAGQWDVARRWVSRAADSPTAEWIQVKLWLYAGKTDQAAALLAQLTRQFPVLPAGTEPTNAPVTLVDNLVVRGFSSLAENIPAANQMLAESGVVHLARREYTESLDALVRSGYWMDAAYVAERVLTVDELKSYVDANWPAEKTNAPAPADNDFYVHVQFPRDIRYLLARRLTRLGQMTEARDYYPEEWQAPLDELSEALAKGRDTTFTARSRFDFLSEAAMITRTNGMELMGTEVEPDWHMWDGEYSYGVTVDSRVPGPLPVSDDEMKRVTENHADPEQRYHYREQAALLRVEAARTGWEAAKVMPDDSEELAHLLCTAGTWLNGREPKLRNDFYLAIIHRCRQTEIGAEAARTGKFPVLDENGRVVPLELKGEDQPEAGKYYVVHAGDTLVHIVEMMSQTMNQTDPAATISNIIQANPGLSADKIRAGQVIYLPGPADANAPPLEMPAVDDSPLPVIPQGSNYKIQMGDSLARIAKAAQVTQQAILDANPGLQAHELPIDQVIVIP